MFTSRTDAVDQLTDIVPDDILPDILALLTPAIGFTPAAAKHSRSRIGGVPDVGPGFIWPRLELSSAEVAALPEAVHSLPGVTLDEGHSLCFIAQVDLDEVGELGDVGAQLPPQGRLLFFWDQMVGLSLIHI